MKFLPLLKKVLSFVRDVLNTIFGEDHTYQKAAEQTDHMYRVLQEERAARAMAEAKAHALELDLERAKQYTTYAVAQAREETRLQISDYLEHTSQIRTGTVFYREESLEIIGFCGSWVRNGLDIEWARARSEQIERERAAVHQPPALVRVDIEPSEESS